MMGFGTRVAARLIGAAITGAVFSAVLAGTAWAQSAWVQVEAQPSLREGEARAQDWSATFPNVAGFAMSTGWYAIALGPYTPEEAAQQLKLLRGERMVPADSYVTDGGKFRQQYWPVGTPRPAPEVTDPGEVAPADPLAANAPETQAPTTLPALSANEALGGDATTGAAPANTVPPLPTEPLVEGPTSNDTAAMQAPALQTPVMPGAEALGSALPDETPQEAATSEALLDRDGKMALQEAMKWQGFYTAAIDGSFGRGTRASMAAWQSARGFEPTGILTSAQRSTLLEAVAEERRALGLSRVTENEAGIEIDLPLGLVEFSRYDPPFVHFEARDGSGVTVLLISEPGDQQTLKGLYDQMQTLSLVPLDGPRNRDRGGFSLTGSNANVTSHTEVTLKNGLIKGFTLAYPTAKDADMQRVLAAMQASMTPLGSTALDDSLGEPLLEPKAGLMSGLEVRTAKLSTSGFYISDQGAVLTLAGTVANCARVTVDGDDFDTNFIDADKGIAVLTPKQPLAPKGVAAFQTDVQRAGSDVAVAGYSYPQAMTAPVLTFGTLADLNGLTDGAARMRLALKALPGDAGGPLFDRTGAVIGMLTPPPLDPARLLPADVTEALEAPALAPDLALHGFAPLAATDTAILAPEDLMLKAQAMTVQVSCW
jgi:peptidoglycan hydrolase-like protein with peptidoglycan-binding domain